MLLQVPGFLCSVINLPRHWTTGKGPKKPMTAFLLFSNAMRAAVKAESPGALELIYYELLYV